MAHAPYASYPSLVDRSANSYLQEMREGALNAVKLAETFGGKFE
jgi:hypothetical protein